MCSISKNSCTLGKTIGHELCYEFGQHIPLWCGCIICLGDPLLVSFETKYHIMYFLCTEKWRTVPESAELCVRSSVKPLQENSLTASGKYACLKHKTTNMFMKHYSPDLGQVQLRWYSLTLIFNLDFSSIKISALCCSKFISKLKLWTDRWMEGGTHNGVPTNHFGWGRRRNSLRWWIRDHKFCVILPMTERDSQYLVI